MRATVLWGVATALVSGMLLVTGGQTAERPLMRDLELEALQEAIRWPNPDVSTVLALVGRFVAAGRDQEAFAYFQERARHAPDRPLFLALEGFFQARIAGEVFLLRRTGWVNAAVAKLDGAVTRDPGVPRYFRGLVLAELPARFEKAAMAVADLQWFLENIAVIRSLSPRLLVHGHPPLTDLFTIEALPAFETAMRELHSRIVARIAEGRPLVDIVHENILPAALREHPEIVLRYLVMRDNFIKRVHLQRTGYWKPDGDGLEVVSPKEWAGALDLLAGGREDAFVTSARTLLGRGDHVLALRLADLGLLTHPASSALSELRRRALDGLRARHQQLNPFKFIIYSESAGADLRPIE